MARYEINHDGMIVSHESALCLDLDKMLTSLFNQYGWTSEIVDKKGSCRKILIKDANEKSRYVYVYCGNIRNEARNPYEKKIQLGTVTDPKDKPKEDTLIIGVYVFEENDGISDAIFVGYPIDEDIRYDTNPSIRGTFVNQLLIDAKNNGFIYDKEHNTVGFLAPFIYYYLDNHYSLHYTSNKYPEVNYANDSSLDIEEDFSDGATVCFETTYDTKMFSHNRILFGAPGTGKSFTLNREAKKLLADGGYEERVTFHPDYSYANFVGTYKPVMVSANSNVIDDTSKEVLSILTDKTKSAQEKYDLLYDRFKGDGLTRLPILLGLYTDEVFRTRKQDGTDAVGDNSVERNHGKAIRPYVALPSDLNEREEIGYEYVPGPFMRVLAKALKSAMTDDPKPHLLIIEEINRANVAAVFGDVFQLLDRAATNISEYEIATTNEMRAYLAKELGVDKSAVETIKIPNNMFLWATMNSADQGVFPMDTAFKRRWDFTYLGIDDSENDLIGKTVTLGAGNTKQKVEWNKLRKAINNFLANEKINEDKQLGPYFIAKNIVVPEEGTEIDNERFIRTFKSKVIMYLFEDAAKQKRSKLFEGCFESKSRYSEICQEFEEKGIGIFHPDIQIEAEAEDLTEESPDKNN
ncbi:MAG: AAA family ATPase [Firmicutes bacterium]|nr:AAA family ATPase [Bacillota bacterium]